MPKPLPYWAQDFVPTEIWTDFVTYKLNFKLPTCDNCNNVLITKMPKLNKAARKQDQHFPMTGTCDRFTDRNRPLYMVYCYACKTVARVDAESLDQLMSTKGAAEYLKIGCSKLTKLVDKVAYDAPLEIAALRNLMSR